LLADQKRTIFWFETTEFVKYQISALQADSTISTVRRVHSYAGDGVLDGAEVIDPMKKGYDKR